jgi:hypothetical protein
MINLQKLLNSFIANYLHPYKNIIKIAKNNSNKKEAKIPKSPPINSTNNSNKPE